MTGSKSRVLSLKSGLGVLLNTVHYHKTCTCEKMIAFDKFTSPGNGSAVGYYFTYGTYRT